MPRKPPQLEAMLGLERRYGLALTRTLHTFAQAIRPAGKLLRDGDIADAEAVIKRAHRKTRAEFDAGAVRELAGEHARKVDAVTRKQCAGLVARAAREDSATRADRDARVTRAIQRFEKTNTAKINREWVDGQGDHIATLHFDSARWLSEELERIHGSIESGREWSAADIDAALAEALGKGARKAELIGEGETNTLAAWTRAALFDGAEIVTSRWRTMLDDRVRPEHQEREGVEFPSDEGISGELPGEPPNCRCYSEPVLPPDDGDE